ncbi:MAG: twin-arginine translocation signal domain-containing protein [bacterium]
MNDKAAIDSRSPGDALVNDESTSASRARYDRRAFLKGCAVAGVAAAGASSSEWAQADEGEPIATVARRGYHETRHIRRYYQAARF